MNKKLVPVRISTIENHGVRYDVYDRGAIHPVNFNGVEWYFEAETSPSVSLAVREKVGKELDQYESLLTPTTLSPPDENGLMWNSAGRSYIRIKRTIPSISSVGQRNESLPFGEKISFHQ